MTKKCFLTNYYTVFVIIAIILNMYKFNSLFTFADIGFFILYGIFMLKCLLNYGNSIKIKLSYNEIIPFFICVLYWFFYSYMNLDTSIFFRNARYLLYLITVMLYTKKYFDYDLGFKVYKFVAVLSTMYLFTQYIFRNLFGIYLLNYVPFLEVSSKGIMTVVPVRCKSIFAEPSQYAIYITGALMLILIDKYRNKFDYIYILILILGIFLSGSTTGIAIVVFSCVLYALHLLKNVKQIKRKKVINLMAISLIAIVIVLSIAIGSGMLSYIIYRVSEGSSADARFSSYELINSFSNKLTGNGMLDIEKDYYNGVVRCVYYFGYIGIASWGILTLGQLRKSYKEYKILVVIFFVLNIGTEVLFGPQVLIWFSFIMKSYSLKERGEEDEDISYGRKWIYGNRNCKTVT